MFSLAELRDELTDERSRTAVLAGLASIPFTVLLSWDSDPSTFSGTPILVAGLLVGYLYSERSMESRRAGKLVGLVGAVPVVLWSVVYVFSVFRTEPTRIAAVFAVLAPIGIAVGAGILVLIGVVGAIIGDGIATRLDAGASGTTKEDVEDAGWWRYVAAYALAAPPLATVGLGIGFVLDGVGILVGALAILSLLALAVVALYALFEDAAALRRAGAVWQPNLPLFVGVPLGACALVYLAATLLSSANPSGDAAYGFVAALWVTVVTYLALRRRRVDTLRRR